MVVREWVRCHQGRTRFPERGEKLSWQRYSSEGDHGLPTQRCDGRILDQVRPQNIKTGRKPGGGFSFIPPDQHGCATAAGGGADGLAQRSSWQYPAIAKSSPSVNRQYRGSLCQGWILQSVVHQQQSGTRTDCRPGAGSAIRARPGWCHGGQQQGLVAHKRRKIVARDPMYAPGGTAIPPKQNVNPGPGQPPGKIENQCCFARPAYGRIAAADDRHRGNPAGARHPPRGDGRADCRQWRQRPGNRTIFKPKGRCPRHRQGPGSKDSKASALRSGKSI